jgi:hypothetical protein
MNMVLVAPTGWGTKETASGRAVRETPQRGEGCHRSGHPADLKAVIRRSEGGPKGFRLGGNSKEGEWFAPLCLLCVLS